jgi:hypothetical protein
MKTYEPISESRIEISDESLRKLGLVKISNDPDDDRTGEVFLNEDTLLYYILENGSDEAVLIDLNGSSPYEKNVRELVDA